jgi:hypothetical protein
MVSDGLAMATLGHGNGHGDDGKAALGRRPISRPDVCRR